ncbi:hypothetical protein CHS0354_028814 [Potamilus streckersoni]|uniref:Integrase core domain-containing protein n=1 Tax=Potamilus streckersoni TaxID=2493646 RepID=A0AAE0VM16_9BIVA|nr:hypothetical protein CHS0354_028814 [Potamilus streckersoni]
MNNEIPKPEVEYGFLGRPAFYIPSQTLEFFIQNGFKVKEMADMLGVSKQTVERRLNQLDLKVRQMYSLLCDEELDQEVKKLTTEFPFVVYRTISAILLSQGHRVQEYRIRQAMLNVDPQGVLFRRLFITTCRVQRRTYVSGPQFLWHIDGNHKLVRIERLWRELWSGCTATYYQLFFHMEDIGILQIENELHLQVLHLVYLRRIQTHLDQFCEALKRRPLRTENNRSPMQLWILGQVQNPTLEPQNEADLQSYGIDYNGPAAVTCGSVQVPETPPLSDWMVSEIQHILSQESNCFSVDLYEQILNFLQ